MGENFRIVAEKTVTRFINRLHVETEPERRELFRTPYVRCQTWSDLDHTDAPASEAS
jgi:hypothetical protein